jgi:hypothetical protein
MSKKDAVVAAVGGDRSGAKSLRRGRSSDSADELMVADTSEKQAAVKKGRRKVERGASQVRTVQGRAVTSEAVEAVEQLPVDQHARRPRGRPSKNIQAETQESNEPEMKGQSRRKKQKQVEGAANPKQSLRRGRSSYTGAEVEAIFNQAVYHTTNNAGRRVDSDLEVVESSTPYLKARTNRESGSSGGSRLGKLPHTRADVHDTLEQATEPQYKHKRKGKTSEEQVSEMEDLAGDDKVTQSKQMSKKSASGAPERRGRSSNTAAEVQAIFEEAVYKGKKIGSESRGRRSATVLEVVCFLEIQFT